MTKLIGRNRNLNTEAQTTEFTLSDTTSTIISLANDKRIYFRVDNASTGRIVYVKLQAANVDNDKRGVRIKEIDIFEMTGDNIYTGEISAIAEMDEPIIFVTEF